MGYMRPCIGYMNNETNNPGVLHQGCLLSNGSHVGKGLSAGEKYGILTLIMYEG